MSDEQPLDQLTDEELGQRVRNTVAFRAAAACAKFADEAQELRANDALAFGRQVRETHARQGTSVSKLETTDTIVGSFSAVLDVQQELRLHGDDARLGSLEPPLR